MYLIARDAGVILLTDAKLDASDVHFFAETAYLAAVFEVRFGCYLGACVFGGVEWFLEVPAPVALPLAHQVIV